MCGPSTTRGAVVTLLAVCRSTHGKCYVNIVMVGIVGALLALVGVIVLGSVFGSLYGGHRPRFVARL
jgi:ABC-type multidrug transport system permease subunit